MKYLILITFLPENINSSLIRKPLALRIPFEHDEDKEDEDCLQEDNHLDLVTPKMGKRKEDQEDEEKQKEKDEEDEEGFCQR